MTANDRIAEIIKKFCKEDCIMTQRELAKAMDVTPACVNKWIREGSISLDKISAKEITYLIYSFNKVHFYLSLRAQLFFSS